MKKLLVIMLILVSCKKEITQPKQLQTNQLQGTWINNDPKGIEISLLNIQNDSLWILLSNDEKVENNKYAYQFKNDTLSIYLDTIYPYQYKIKFIASDSIIALGLEGLESTSHLNKIK